MNKDNKASIGCRIYVPFDEWTDLSFVVPVLCSDKKIHKLSPRVMVHIESSHEGVIFWFQMSED